MGIEHSPSGRKTCDVGAVSCNVISILSIRGYLAWLALAWDFRLVYCKMTGRSFGRDGKLTGFAVYCRWKWFVDWWRKS